MKLGMWRQHRGTPFPLPSLLVELGPAWPSATKHSTGDASSEPTQGGGGQRNQEPLGPGKGQLGRTGRAQLGTQHSPVPLQPLLPSWHSPIPPSAQTPPHQGTQVHTSIEARGCLSPNCHSTQADTCSHTQRSIHTTRCLHTSMCKHTGAYTHRHMQIQSVHKETQADTPLTLSHLHKDTSTESTFLHRNTHSVQTRTLHRHMSHPHTKDTHLHSHSDTPIHIPYPHTRVVHLLYWMNLH